MKKREVLFILISILILVVTWVAFNIYHSSVTSTIPDSLSIQIEPIDATFDEKTIDALKKRDTVQGLYTIIASSSASVTPTTTPVLSPPVGTQSAQVGRTP